MASVGKESCVNEVQTSDNAVKLEQTSDVSAYNLCIIVSHYVK